MKSLFLCMGMPFPPDSGKRMRNFAFLRVLAAAGEVTLVSLASSAQELAAADELRKRLCRVETVDFSIPKLATARDYLARLRGIFASEPYGALRFQSAAVTGCLQKLFADESYDVVVCDEVFMLQNLPREVAFPVLLGKDHIATMILDRYVSGERNPLKRAYARLEQKRMELWEAQMCRRASAVMACSEIERRILTGMCPGIPVTVAPNVVDVDSYIPVGGGNEPMILYQGAMEWFPNQDAVNFFVSAILPLIREQIPQARFVIAGRGAPPAFEQQFSGPHVEFTGAVPDMRPIMAEAAVCVVPLRIAGGTRLKILEGGAMGKAMVSTRIGAEGLELAEGKEILLADTPEAFAEATVRVLRDHALRSELGAAARKRVEADYGLPALERALRKTLAHIGVRRVEVFSRTTA